MMKNKEVIIQDAKGAKLHSEFFFTKRQALKYARRMYSPLYDVLYSEGRERIYITKHIPPDELGWF